MKKVADYICVAVFFIIAAMFAVGTIVQGSSVSFLKDKDNSVNEYVSRNFPLNNNWKSLYFNIMTKCGRDEFNGIYVADERLIKYKNNFDKEQIEKTTESINAFAKSIKTPVFVMIVPTASGIYYTDLPAYSQNVEQNAAIDNIYLKLNSKISTIDAFYPLYAERNQYIYYRTEDSWTSLGAYYAYIEAVKKLGFEAVNMSNYDKEYACDNYYGSLFQSVYDTEIKPDRINVYRSKFKSPVTSVIQEKGKQTFSSKSVYFNSALKSDKKTDIFLQGDNYEKTVIDTDVPNSKKLLIFKGSCANSFVPFLTAHYSRITIIDPELMAARGKNLADLVNIDDYDQILFMCSFNEYANGHFDGIINK